MGSGGPGDAVSEGNKNSTGVTLYSGKLIIWLHSACTETLSEAELKDDGAIS